MKKGVLRNFTKITVKHLCQSLFFNKVAGLRAFAPLQNTNGRLFLGVSYMKLESAAKQNGIKIYARL